MATNTSNISLPTQQEPISGSDLKPSLQWWRFFQAIYSLFAAIPVPQDILLTTGEQELTGGFTNEELDLGTPANGSTITPNPSDNLKQVLTNNVAGFTIAATAQCGDVELRIINGATPGTITFSGFDKQWPSDPIALIAGNEYVVFIYGYVAKKAYLVKALQ